MGSLGAAKIAQSVKHLSDRHQVLSLILRIHKKSQEKHCTLISSAVEEAELGGWMHTALWLATLAYWQMRNLVSKNKLVASD